MHAFRLILDAFDDDQQLRLVLLQALLQDLDLGHLALEPVHQVPVLPSVLADRQQVADLFQREARGLGPGNDLQDPDRLGAVVAIAVCLALDRTDQSAGLVEADARGRQAAELRQFTNSHVAPRKKH
ncbi:hypothetical protein D3C84_793700 [compost metagenome]